MDYFSLRRENYHNKIKVLVTMIILILFLLDCIYIELFKGAKRADIIMAKLAKEELRK